jgi:hypothetical protein
LADLLTGPVLDLAAEGLAGAGLGAAEAEQWLGVIRARAARSMTGADWQVAWARRHGRDLPALVNAYAARQAGNRPVHEWSTE